MWAFRGTPPIKETIEERCLKCGTKIALLPLQIGKDQVSWICALCAAKLLKKGYLQILYNPSARKPFTIMLVKEICKKLK